MQLLLYILSLFLLHFSASSQSREGLNSIHARDLRAHVQFLASDELEGREAGRRGERIAAKYIASTFTRLGLTPLGDGGTYSQSFQVEELQVGEISFVGVKKSGGDWKLFDRMRRDFFLLSSSAGTDLTAEVVFAGYGISAPEYGYDDYGNIDVAGKLVLVFVSEPQEKDSPSVFMGEKQTVHSAYWSKRRLAEERGALGILVVVGVNAGKSLEDTLARFNAYLSRRAARLVGGSKSLPLFFITPELGNDILSLSGKTLEQLQNDIDGDLCPSSFPVTDVHVKLYSEAIIDTIASENIVGMIPGTHPALREQAIVLTAHYDHVGVRYNGEVYNGADDNASGTAALLELAEAFAKQPVKRSVICIAFSAEEKGLLGSEYFVGKAPISLSRIVANLNVDMIGRIDDEHYPDSNYVYGIGSDRLSSELHTINEKANSQTVRLSLNYRYNDPKDPARLFERSDHYNFAKKGIPVIFYTSGIHPDYHRTTDTWEKLSFGKMEATTKLIYQTAYLLGNRERSLTIDGGTSTDAESNR